MSWKTTNMPDLMIFFVHKQDLMRVNGLNEMKKLNLIYKLGTVMIDHDH